MPAISYGEAHGYGGHGAGWDDRPPAPGGKAADAAELLSTLSGLAEAERWAEARWLGGLVDVEAARLTAWQLGQPQPDPTAPLPISQAEQACRDAQAAATFARWRA
jgi:hypothetical protein